MPRIITSYAGGSVFERIRKAIERSNPLLGTTEAMKAKPKKRKPYRGKRGSTRYLLLLALFSAIAFGWRYNRTRREQSSSVEVKQASVVPDAGASEPVVALDSVEAGCRRVLGMFKDADDYAAQSITSQAFGDTTRLSPERMSLAGQVYNDCRGFSLGLKATSIERESYVKAVKAFLDYTRSQ